MLYRTVATESRKINPRYASSDRTRSLKPAPRPLPKRMPVFYSTDVRPRECILHATAIHGYCLVSNVRSIELCGRYSSSPRWSFDPLHYLRYSPRLRTDTSFEPNHHILHLSQLRAPREPTVLA